MKAPNEFKEQKGVEAPVAFASEIRAEIICHLSETIRKFFDQSPPVEPPLASGGHHFHAEGKPDYIISGDNCSLSDIIVPEWLIKHNKDEL